MDITMNAQVCAETDIGLKREQNEDCYIIINRNAKDTDIQNYGMMFAVADGMGGHAGGEIASKMACRGMADYYSEKTDWPEGTGDFNARLETLRSCIDKVHNKIIDYGRINKEFEDMGTTLSALVLTKNKALIAHVGDSRIYRLRQDFFEQLTEDHSLLNDYIKAKKLTPEEIDNFPHKNVIVRALGMKDMVTVDLTRHPVSEGDIYLMCSDGLSGMLNDQEILHTVLEITDPGDACKTLIQKANEAGGVDNITVIINRVESL